MSMKNIVAVETAKSIDEACAALEKAVAAHHFGILHVHDIRQTLAKKGVGLEREVRIFDVCNPQRAKQVLEANPLAATALPCAIAVFAEGKRTTLAFIQPTAMLGLFGSEDLQPVAEEVERAVREIVEAAARYPSSTNAT
jgi:uncharacterized protein (DUF302 family)